MTQPLIMNQGVHVCPHCWGMVQPHTHGMHMRVCPGRLAPTIPPPTPRGLSNEWQGITALAMWQNGWSDAGGLTPPSSFRATRDLDLQIVLAALPGTFAQPMFTIQRPWIPLHTYAVGATDPDTFGQVCVVIQGYGDAVPGAVTATRTGTPPASVRASIRIPLTL